MARSSCVPEVNPYDRYSLQLLKVYEIHYQDVAKTEH